MWLIAALRPEIAAVAVEPDPLLIVVVVPAPDRTAMPAPHCDSPPVPTLVIRPRLLTVLFVPEIRTPACWPPASEPVEATVSVVFVPVSVTAAAFAPLRAPARVVVPPEAESTLIVPWVVIAPLRVLVPTSRTLPAPEMALVKLLLSPRAKVTRAPEATLIAPVIEPPVPPSPTWSVPLVTVVPPVKVLFPNRAT